MVDARDLLDSARRVTVLSGAGMSTASGIPDFRGPQGLWTRDPAAARMFDIDAYVSDPEIRRIAWRNRRDHPAWTAQPNDAHRALVSLEEQGRLVAICTQNIDGLHQAAGSGRTVPVIELHGTLHNTICLDCGDRRPMPETLARVDAGEVDPPCLACGGMVKSDTISFGQSLDPEVLAAAAQAAASADVLLALGTSLQVNPAAGLVDIAHRSGAAIVIANAERTPYDAIATALVREPLEQILPILLAG